MPQDWGTESCTEDLRHSCSSISQTMGGSSLKKAMFWKKKKKKSPLNKAFSEIKKVLPKKKTRRKSIFQKKDKQSKKKFSLTKEKKSSQPPPLLLKKLTLGDKRKESLDSASGERKEKDKGGLGRVGEQIKKKLSLENQKELKAQAQGRPLENSKEDTDKTFKMKKLKDIMRSNRTTEPKETRKLS
ncbi:hypothetical protein OJAV_G00003350 [Oryzias javanicus]|uniref:Uncharacterized protein n=1 Tax=Oryzias javanicus TaxID=123683 RepID=A0A3S2PHH9_ORYJA|nr:hypothetical protein OJAV_G00003350 [Oryzias javanicus]